MAAVGRVRDFFFFLLLFPPPVSSPPLFAALAARAVALGGMLLDGAGAIDEEIVRSIDRLQWRRIDRSIDPEMSFVVVVVTGGCASVLFENRRD